MAVELVYLLLVASTFASGVHGLVPQESGYGGKGAKTISTKSGTNNPAYLVEAHHGAVASENILCSNIGVDVLKDGGSAVDAAVAATICSGVVNMFSSGIGGGGFMTVRVAPGQVYTIDFRETAPAASNATMFGTDPKKSLIGGLGVGVPGELRGLEEAHRRWGRLPWKRLIDPSVKLAKGWTVPRELNRRIGNSRDLLLNNPDWSAIFAPNGTLLKEGDTIRNLALSRTLDTIAKHGAEAFYKGPLAASFAAKARSTGGILTEADIASYKVIVKKALQSTYRGQKVYTSNAPASGPALLFSLNILEHYNLPKEGFTPVNFHRTIESIKFGFGARTRIGDPNPRYRNDTSLLDEISTKAFAASAFKNLTDNTTHPGEYYHPITDTQIDHGTMGLTTIDSHGVVVALTSTVNSVFGSQVLDPATGVILNNELDDFAKPGVSPNGLAPSPFNFPAPGKRPLSSIVPTIVENHDGSFKMSTAAAGGARIYTAVLQTLLHVLDYGRDISAAIESGRAHHTLYPNVVDLDDAFPAPLFDGLRARGHNLTIHDINNITSSVQGIVKKKGIIYAASDSRKNAVAAGL